MRPPRFSLRAAYVSLLLVPGAWCLPQATEAGGIFENGAIFQELNTNGTDVAAGDFDGDGRADLLVSHADAGTLSLLRGNGDGSVDLVQEVPAGAGCGPLATGDLDGDGHPDVVVANQSATSLTIFLARGSSLVGATVTLPGAPIQAQVGDLDRDSHLDVIVLLSSPAEVGWLRAHGDGTFDPYATLVPVVSSSTAQQLEITDLDQDNDLDALVMVAGFATGSVGVALGDGSGNLGAFTFQTFPSPGPGKIRLTYGPMRLRPFSNGTTQIWVYASESRMAPGGIPGGDPPCYMISTWSASGGTAFTPTQNTNIPVDPSFRLLDVTGDGRGDIVFGSKIGFEIPVPPGWGTSSTYGGSTGMAAADMDGDSHADLIGLACGVVTVALLHPSTFSIASGEGVSYASGYEGPFAFADLDEDGHTDAVELSPHVLVLWHGASDGTFGPAVLSSVDVPLHQHLEPGDVNGDGRADLVAYTGDGFTNTSADILVMANEPGTSFGSPAVFSNPAPVRVLALGDVNHDGRADAVVGLATGLSVLLGNADATFGQGASYPSTDILADVELADLDRDGNLDAIVARWNADAVSVWHGNGDGTFAPLADYPTSQPKEVVAADLNQDGWMDVCIQTPDGMITRLGSAGGLGAPLAALAPPVSAIVLEDLDLDGRPDALYFQSTTQRSAGACGPFRVAFGRGEGTFQVEGIYARGFAHVVTAAPVDPGATS